MKSLTFAAAVGLALVLPFGANRALAQCASCVGCGQQAAAITKPVKLVSLNGDTVDLVKEKQQGPKVLFTFRTDSVGRGAVATVQKVWAAFNDSSLKILGVFCGQRKQAEALKKELSLDFTILLDQGCAGQLVLGLERCPGVVFVNDAGQPVGLVYEFLEEPLREGMEAAVEPSTAVDPVCKMTVDKMAAAAKYVYQAKTYYFCSAGCRDAFEANPENYLND